MPEPKRNRLAATVFWNPDLYVAPRKKPKKKPARRAKRYHRAFRLPIALGLFPTKSRQCDPFGLRLSTMHIMEGDCEKTPGCLAAEDAPQIKATTNGIDNSPGENGLGQSPERVTESPVDQSRDQPTASPDRVVGSPDQPAENGISDDVEHPTEPPLLEGDEEEEDASSTKVRTEPSSPDPLLAEAPEDPLKNKDNSESPVPNFVNSVPSGQSSVKDEKEDVCSEEEEKPSLPSVQPEIKEPEVRRKRSIDADREGEASSSSESDSVRKRLKHTTKKEPSLTVTSVGEHLNVAEDERENTIQRFIDSCTQSVEELNMASEKLQKEMTTLTELAKAKESEWNSILRLKKLKEEIYERLQRKKREALVLEGKFTEELFNPLSLSSHIGINSMLASSMMSSSPMASKMIDVSKQQRPILPKPFPQNFDHLPGNREGRNGHILDVKSIIADYSRGVGCRRSRYPDIGLPRRGRRTRGEPPRLSSSTSPSLISMANMALGTGSSVRTIHDPPPYPPPPIGQDMGRGDHQLGGCMSFKDALVQFAKLGPGGGSSTHGRVSSGSSAPYPEVTLHPVGAPPNSSSSLLHGILTKGPAPAHSKPATFSPTLARLLTAPDPRPQPAHQNSHIQRPLVDNDTLKILAKKSRTDITITPVSGNPSSKPKEEVVLLDDDEDASGGDRLVIDEGPDGASDDVPQCQGCRQKSAQFVCAGCGNQWYCSRECQVTAWEEHSDVCSG